MSIFNPDVADSEDVGCTDIKGQPWGREDVLVGEMLAA